MYLSYTLPYLLYLLICALLFLNANTQYKIASAKKAVYCVSLYTFFSVTIIFIGCRGYIGADWLVYKPFFDSAPTLIEHNKIYRFISKSVFEKGFSIYVILVKSIYNDYLFFQFISFIIDILLLHIFFDRYCKKYYFLCWVFYWILQGYVFEMIILRNVKSIILFLLSIKYIEKRKFLPYLFLNLLGFTFHSSSIIYFPLYFIALAKRRKIVEIILFIFGNCIYLLQIKWFSNILIKFSTLFFGRLSLILAAYLKSENFMSSYGITIGYIERLFTFCLFYKFSDTLISENPKNKVFYFLFLFYSYIFLFFSEILIILERIPNLFICSYWILYPQIYQRIKKDWKKFFLFLLIIYGLLRTMSLLNAKYAFYDNFIFGSLSPKLREQKYTY